MEDRHRKNGNKNNIINSMYLLYTQIIYVTLSNINNEILRYLYKRGGKVRKGRWKKGWLRKEIE